MKLLFFLIAILINFFNQSLIKSEEKIDSANKIVENISKEESITEDKTKKRKIHIVKSGDTITSISKIYSINKDLIIRLNNLKNENYIYVGQNLIISESSDNFKELSNSTNNFHIVAIGENLTEISDKYKLNLQYLIEINDLKNPDSIKVGDKLFISQNDELSSENYQIINNKNNDELQELDSQIYGPLVIQNKSYDKIKGRKILNVLNQENKKLILSINCDKNELDVRIPGRQWMGGRPAKEEFEKKLMNDFC